MQEAGCCVTLLTPPGPMAEVWRKLGAQTIYWDPPMCQWLGKLVYSSGVPARGANVLLSQWLALLKLPARERRAQDVIRQALGENKETGIYVNSLTLFPLASTLASLRSDKRRVSWQIRELLNPALPLPVYSRILQGIVRASDTIIAISSNEAAPFKRFAPVEVIHNSVSREWVDGAMGGGKGDLTIPRVGMASDFHTGKGLADFVTLAELLHPKCPTAEFVLYTPHPHIEQGPTARILRLAGLWNDKVPLVMDALGNAKELSLKGNVKLVFDHSMDFSTMSQLTVYARADRAGVAWGRDVIEAMWAGVPVVATGTSEEFVREGKTGFLVPPGRPDLLAERVYRLLSDSQLHGEMSEASRLRARKLFAPEMFKARLKEVLFEERGARDELAVVKAGAHVS